MLRIAPFARELGMDTIILPLLRDMPYTGLGELVARTPGYHVAPTGKRHIYSDEYSVGHLKRLARRLLRSFYSPGQVLHVLKKCLRNRVITPGTIARLPGFLVRKGLEHRKKARRKRERLAAQTQQGCGHAG
jgi:hypothetical protein